VQKHEFRSELVSKYSRSALRLKVLFRIVTLGMFDRSCTNRVLRLHAELEFMNFSVLNES
jgi:hypothetical protein